MPCEPFRQPHLIVPAKAVFGILREFDIIWRIGINKIVVFNRNFFKVTTLESPPGKNLLVGTKISGVINCRIPPKRDVELTLPIEPAQTVETGSV